LCLLEIRISWGRKVQSQLRSSCWELGWAAFELRLPCIFLLHVECIPFKQNNKIKNKAWARLQCEMGNTVMVTVEDLINKLIRT
jgi:hypothetical protein